MDTWQLLSRQNAATTLALPGGHSPDPLPWPPLFLRPVQHSLAMAAAFQDAGFPAAAVHGKLPQAEREHLLQQFKAGKIQASH